MTPAEPIGAPAAKEPQDDASTVAKRLGSAIGRAAGTAAHDTRETIRRNPTANRVYRTGVGVVGASAVAFGIVLIPLPGPGALVAIGGLGLLSTEFEGAKKVSSKANSAVRKAAAGAKELRVRLRAARSPSD